jgi:hypothetical protein
VTLDAAVGLVAAQAALNECKQEPLAEDEAAAGVEVLAHAIGVDDEALDEPAETVEHIVDGEEGVRQHDSFGRRV